MYYRDDPRWIRARYPGRCQRCSGTIHAGARAFYYPKGKVLLCGLEPCGGSASREFEAAAADEAFMGGGRF